MKKRLCKKCCEKHPPPIGMNNDWLQSPERQIKTSSPKVSRGSTNVSQSGAEALSLGAPVF